MKTQVKSPPLHIWNKREPKEQTKKAVMRKRAVLMEEMCNCWERAEKRFQDRNEIKKLHHKRMKQPVVEQPRRFLFSQMFGLWRKSFFPSQAPETAAWRRVGASQPCCQDNSRSLLLRSHALIGGGNRTPSPAVRGIRSVRHVSGTQRYHHNFQEPYWTQSVGLRMSKQTESGQSFRKV